MFPFAGMFPFCPRRMYMDTMTATDPTRNVEIANTIRRQIGGPALYMLGAKDLAVVGNGLRFRVRGSKKANTVTITLDPSDTYTVRISKVVAPRYMRKAGTFTKGSDSTVLQTSDVYVDMLHNIIREGTGLATRI